MELSYLVAGWPAGGADGRCDPDPEVVLGDEEGEEVELPVVVGDLKALDEVCSSSSNSSSNLAIVDIAASVACIWREKSGLKSI